MSLPAVMYHILDTDKIYINELFAYEKLNQKDFHFLKNTYKRKN